MQERGRGTDEFAMAINLYKDALAKDSTEDKRKIACYLYNLGLKAVLSNTSQALYLLNASVALVKALESQTREDNKDLGKAYHMMALIQCKNENFWEALKFYNLAIKSYLNAEESRYAFDIVATEEYNLTLTKGKQLVDTVADLQATETKLAGSGVYSPYLAVEEAPAKSTSPLRKLSILPEPSRGAESKNTPIETAASRPTC